MEARLQWKADAGAVAATAAAICLLVFLPALTCGFVNLDDHEYVLNNPLIRKLDPEGLAKVFSGSHAGFWMPLTWMSLALDYHFWGLNPLGYHLTNILLHSANTGLVVLVADRLMSRRVSEEHGGQVKYLYPLSLLLAGLLWGVHPLRVESVAWVTERKDVLNGLFAFSSLLCYLRYVRESDENGSGLPAYLFSLFLFVCSLMAKPVTVVLPLVLLVLDWYPLGRFRKYNYIRTVIEKVPFLACSMAMAVLTLVFASHNGILASTDSLTPLQRLLISGAAIFDYCRLMLLPAGIMPLHIIDLAELATYALKTAAIVMAGAVLYLSRRKRAIIAAALCLILPLLPVLAFFQNGLQAFAARFSYLPSVAPTILLSSLCLVASKPSGDGRLKRLLPLLAAVLIFACYATATVLQIGVWKSTETVWSRVIQIKPSGRAYKERGLYRLAVGNISAAAGDLAMSLEYARRAELPEIFNLHAYLGEALRLQQKYVEAVDEFSSAISLCPYGGYYFRRGLALEGVGRMNEAAADFRRAGNTPAPLVWLERNSCD